MGGRLVIATQPSIFGDGDRAGEEEGPRGFLVLRSRRRIQPFQLGVEGSRPGKPSSLWKRGSGKSCHSRNRIGQNLADEGLSAITPSEGRAGGITGNEYPYSSTPIDLIRTTVHLSAEHGPGVKHATQRANIQYG
ncbi:hypothetical protein CSAL01_03093 [Colletotrichum salicis]|uniref:Uncharacterized protein n=1 Tax=Colletotrichum salicis TaxID=1209931 RepID=A0A135UIP9_9PEZI|nr:hypothetical protein CSAL01_03093 [Colletotrichum salicis]